MIRLARQTPSKLRAYGARVQAHLLAVLPGALPSALQLEAQNDPFKFISSL